MRIVWLAVLSLAILACPTGGRAQEKQPAVVAVFMIENRGSPLSPDELLALTDYLGTKLGERGMFQIIPRDEIRRRLTDQKTESFKACYDQSCQIEIGREMAAGMTVSSSISKVGSTCIVTAALYDLQKAATSNTATAKGKCTADDLLTAMEQIADKLQGISPEKPRPPQVVTAAPPPVAEVPRMPPRQPRTKSTVVACLLAFFPGGGMFYLERWGWGTFYLTTAIAGMVGTVMFFVKDQTELAIASIVLMDGSVLTSLIHTYYAAVDWKDPDLVVEKDKNALGALPPALVFPVFSVSF